MPKTCFMIMPYGCRPTEADAGCGPAEIDFNALWDRAYVPVIKALGYEPVRADQDTGALIINQMLERLYFADLVLADMTIPNGNVYYEVGIRHAAQKTGCVLLSADWAKPLFDVAQMRTIRYPLADGDIGERTAKAFQAIVHNGIANHSASDSPMYLALPGYPSAVKAENASIMKEQLAELAAFQAKVRAVRAVPRGVRMRLAQQLIASDGTPPRTYTVAVTLMRLLRDSADNASDWDAVLDFLLKLPPEFVEQPDARNHLAFAVCRTSNVIQAITELTKLIDTDARTLRNAR